MGKQVDAAISCGFGTIRGREPDCRSYKPMWEIETGAQFKSMIGAEPINSSGSLAHLSRVIIPSVITRVRGRVTMRKLPGKGRMQHKRNDRLALHFHMAPVLYRKP